MRRRFRRDPVSRRIEDLARDVADLRDPIDRHEHALVLADLVEETGYDARHGIRTARPGPTIPYTPEVYDRRGVLANVWPPILLPTEEVIIGIPEYAEHVTSHGIRTPSLSSLGQIYRRYRVMPETIRNWPELPLYLGSRARVAISVIPSDVRHKLGMKTDLGGFQVQRVQQSQGDKSFFRFEPYDRDDDTTEIIDERTGRRRTFRRRVKRLRAPFIPPDPNTSIVFELPTSRSFAAEVARRIPLRPSRRSLNIPEGAPISSSAAEAVRSALAALAPRRRGGPR